MDTARTVQAGIVTGTVVLLVFFLGYDAVVGETLLGVEATTAAEWTFGILFAGNAVLYLLEGQRSLAAGYGLATVGWLLVLLGSSSVRVVIGAVVLVTAGCFIAIRTARRQRVTESPAV